MEAVKEITGGLFPAHTYLLDGTTLVAYIRVGTVEPYYFKSGIKGFSKSGRKFEVIKANPFTPQAKAEPTPWILQVQGSKPNTFYQVNTSELTCTCPGYTFRGDCKHIKQLETA